LLNVIADKTGFPEDMLNDDMNLEDDLAVDSIRRVEILGAVQEKFPEAPVVGPSQMGILNTIGDIVSYLCDDKKKTALAKQLFLHRIRCV
ncbi:acyl carrier protein, partial [bacterium]|nr:acyl carrier protein [bacterium]